ncbi:hypothetical protein ACT29H_01650 [Thermophagus sp. OGC60D27]|uniref:hypothetical protein n=1 Tax=Thermophagus sp. OGC60D27 TaxID=3458415 RepID=UPI004037ADD1
MNRRKDNSDANTGYTGVKESNDTNSYKKTVINIGIVAVVSLLALLAIVIF